MTRATIAVVGSRCVYYPSFLLPSLLERESEIEKMEGTRSPSVKRHTNADPPSYSKSTIHFLLAKENPSTPSSSEHPTPRSWLISKMTEGYATTFYPLGSLANALDNIREVINRLTSETVGVIRTKRR